jgi:hypothetical protein
MRMMIALALLFVVSNHAMHHHPISLAQTTADVYYLKKDLCAIKKDLERIEYAYWQRQQGAVHKNMKIRLIKTHKK